MSDNDEPAGLDGCWRGCEELAGEGCGCLISFVLILLALLVLPFTL